MLHGRCACAERAPSAPLRLNGDGDGTGGRSRRAECEPGEHGGGEMGVPSGAVEAFGADADGWAFAHDDEYEEEDEEGEEEDEEEDGDGDGSQ